jgi:DNA modification methylase
MKKVNQKGPTIAAFRLSELKPAGYNPRVISDDAMKGLTASLNRFGCVEPIVVNCRGGKKTIIGGHQRYKALVDLYGKDYECPCVTVDLSARDEKLLNMALNNPHIQGEFSEDLAVMIDQLRAEMPGDDAYVAMRMEELRSELGDTEKQGNVPDDEIPKPPEKAITKPGDLWTMGEHRLLCGDSTKEEDIAGLMGAAKASLMATDPPYIVDYTKSKRPGAKNGQNWREQYREIPVTDGPTFLTDFLRIGLNQIKHAAAMYLWHADRRRGMVDEACKNVGILPHQEIVWIKPFMLMTHSVYCWQHENCLLMWKEGERPEWKKRNKALGTVWVTGFQRTGDPTDPGYYSDVWELDWEGKKRNSGIEHPTVKPVEIFAIPMRVHTNPGDICYEAFCGSGSQIIAAEKLGRRCYALEIEPVFCDVAIKRWEEWTGKKAILEREAGSVKREMEKSKRPGRKGGYKSPKKGKQGQPGATGAK